MPFNELPLISDSLSLSLKKKEEKHKTFKHLKNIFPIHLYNRNKLNQSTSEWQDGAAVASSVENESDRSNAGLEIPSKTRTSVLTLTLRSEEGVSLRPKGGLT